MFAEDDAAGGAGSIGIGDPGEEITPVMVVGAGAVGAIPCRPDTPTTAGEQTSSETWRHLLGEA